MVFMCRHGIKRAFIIPLFFAAGRHMEEIMGDCPFTADDKCF